MEMKKSIRDKILILFMIIISIFGITYKVFSAYYPGQPEYYTDPPWYGKGESDGIIHYDGGTSRDADDKYDSGSLAVGVSSSGGGRSWIWWRCLDRKYRISC